MMNRRRVIAFLASATALWPRVARAQRRERVRRVGVLMGFAGNDEVWQAYLATFRQHLQDLGWSEGSNLRIDYRVAGKKTEGIRIAAAELVALAPDVILVSTNPAVSALIAGDPHDPDRLHVGIRLGGKRLRHEPGASGWKCYRASQL